ncbi:MAG: MFS transporter [Bacillota bacterium]|nr:MFS transporter [Bacillota bacterium]
MAATSRWQRGGAGRRGRWTARLFREELALPALLWLLMGANGVVALVRYTGGPFLTVYVQVTAGLPASAAGMVVGLGSLSGLLVAPVAGRWIDRAGRRAGLALGAFLEALTAAAMATAHSGPGFALAVLAGGAAGTVESLSYRALLSDLAPEALRTRVFGYNYWLLNVGATVGPLLGFRLGAATSPLSWWLSCAAGLVLATLAWRAVPPELGRGGAAAPGADDAAGRPGLRTALALLAEEPRVALFAAAAFFNGLAYSQLHTSLAVLARSVLPGGDASYARLVAVNGLTVLLTQPWLGRLLERRPRLGLVTGELLFALAELGWWRAAPREEVWLALMALFTVGEVFHSPSLQSTAAGLAPPGLRASTFAALSLADGVAYGLGPSAGGRLLEAAGPGALPLAMACASLVAAGLFLRLRDGEGAGPSRAGARR